MLIILTVLISLSCTNSANIDLTPIYSIDLEQFSTIVSDDEISLIDEKELKSHVDDFVKLCQERPDKVASSPEMVNNILLGISKNIDYLESIGASQSLVSSILSFISNKLPKQDIKKAIFRLSKASYGAKYLNFLRKKIESKKLDFDINEIIEDSGKNLLQFHTSLKGNIKAAKEIMQFQDIDILEQDYHGNSSLYNIASNNLRKLYPEVLDHYKNSYNRALAINGNSYNNIIEFLIDIESEELLKEFINYISEDLYREEYIEFVNAITQYAFDKKGEDSSIYLYLSGLNS